MPPDDHARLACIRVFVWFWTVFFDCALAYCKCFDLKVSTVPVARSVGLPGPPFAAAAAKAGCSQNIRSESRAPNRNGTVGFSMFNCALWPVTFYCACPEEAAPYTV